MCESTDFLKENISPRMMGRKDIINLQFNQEHNLFTCAMETGLRVYNINPLEINTSLDSSECGTIAFAQVLHRTNLIALVGGGTKPKFAENTIIIWDDKKKCFVLEFTFSSPVLSVRLRKDRLIAVEKNRIHVFTFPYEPVKLFMVETGENPKGLCEISPHISSERQLLVFPGRECGYVQIIDLNHSDARLSASPTTISAHKGPIACISLNNQGTMLATASDKGTLIRVFDTLRKNLLIEFRRGTDTAMFYCINFSHDSDFLCASSDKGTVHIFALKDTHLNRRSVLYKMSFLGQYVNPQRALTNFTIKNDEDCASICAFGPKSSIYAISVDGSFHKYTFSQDGTCKMDITERYVDLTEEDDLWPA